MPFTDIIQATGIGYAISESFCKTGIAHLILIQRRESVLAEAKRKFEAAYPSVRVTTHAASVTDYSRISSILSSGQIDVLVPCATLCELGPTKDLTPQQLDETFKTNVVAPHVLISEFLKLPAQGERAVVCISAAGTQFPVPNQAAYGSSKAAVNQLVGHYAQEHKGQGMKFVAVHPGAVFTELVGRFASEEMVEWEDAELPGDFAVWLASPEADFLNGKFVWAQWDVDELIGMKKRIKEEPMLLTTSVIV